MGDGMFLVPLLDVAERRSSGGRMTYLYRFDWSNSRFGSCHCVELPFLFGNLETWAAAPMVAGANMSEIAHLSGVFQDAVAAFVRSGDPNCPTVPHWPAFNRNKATMHFDRRVVALGSAS